MMVGSDVIVGSRGVWVGSSGVIVDTITVAAGPHAPAKMIMLIKMIVLIPDLNMRFLLD